MERDQRHPEHDAIRAEIRSWYTESLESVGQVVSRHWFGYLRRPDDNAGARLVLTVGSPSQVAPALDAARQECGPGEISVWVDDRQVARRLHSALRAAGSVPGGSTVHLGLVGDIERHPWPPGLTVVDTTPATLGDWAVVKLQSFADSQEIPDDRQLAKELEARRREAPVARYQMGVVDEEPVAVLACYPGRHQLVFNLGTRLPYRHGGIARAMLAHWVDQARAAGASSMLINADDLGRPAALYRRLGFVDEIYWYQKYVLADG
ncbi:MAG TPA: GNAT family N-acetyltransferase [Acidimicrobiales bacterium]|nr:GNAT family N-acetyltransferase [Acidimicrobiales bacterium]